MPIIKVESVIPTMIVGVLTIVTTLQRRHQLLNVVAVYGLLLVVGVLAVLPILVSLA